MRLRRGAAVAVAVVAACAVGRGSLVGSPGGSRGLVCAARAQTVAPPAPAEASAQATASPGAATADSATVPTPFWHSVQTVIERHLGRPYVWGGTGLRSFDCSGFVWRVMFESGVAIKRTTARKFSMMLPPVPESERWRGGNIIFFDRFRHCGVVNDEATFYHAAVHRGTCLAELTPMWSSKICGFRAMPRMPAAE